MTGVQTCALPIFGDLQARTQSPKLALVTHGEAIQSARELYRRHPDQKEGRLLLGELLIAIAQKQRASDDLLPSQANAHEGLAIIEKVWADSPNDPYLTFAVSAAQGTVGMTEGRLGNLETALEFYRQGVETGERAVELQQGGPEYLRSLLISYSHVGDVLGNPLIPNLGRPEQAVEPFEKMLAMAREIYKTDPLDVRAASDVAITQYRLAAVLPASRAAERRALLESSEKMLEQQLARAPGNLTTQTNMANVKSLLGDYHSTAGAGAQAVQHYREAVALAEQVLPKSNVAAVVTLLRSGVQMALLQSGGGQPREALALLDRLAPVAQKEAERLEGQPLSGDDIIGGRAWQPRLAAAYSTVHAALGDRQTSDQWRAKALAGWQALAAKPGFDARLRREMDTLAASR